MDTNQNENYKWIFDIMNAEDAEDENSKIYYIKSYQRGYRWEIEQVRCLLNDIYINFKNYSKKLELGESTTESKGYAYCIQPLVLKEMPTEDGMERKYSVIDGQQRLTTFALLFKALNRLDKEINRLAEEKNDEIKIEYAREDTLSNLDQICERCKEIEDFDVAGIELNELHTLFDQSPQTDDLLKEKKEKLSQIISKAGKKCNIDGRFMVNVYIYLYLFFKIVCKEKKGDNSYFGFLGKEKVQGKKYEKERLEWLRNMFMYCTTVIWYEPAKKEYNKQISEEEIFEKFNSQKIPLTKSELVKALFMNPDNYIKEGKQDYNREAIKTKQIMIGIKWDEVEQALHDDELWHFFPHYDKWHSQTRFDALIDYFVYCQYTDENDVADEKIPIMWESDRFFSYKQLEKWIKKELDNAEDSYGKSEIMNNWWQRICDLYDSFAIFFQPNKELIKLYHRLSLIHWMDSKYYDAVIKKNECKKYFSRLKANKELFGKLNTTKNTEKVRLLNDKIKEEIDKFYKNDTLSRTFSVEDISVNKEEILKSKEKLKLIIKSLVMDSKNYLMESFLLMFSMSILEKHAGTISRFSFYEYTQQEKTKNKNDWVFEHIFAKGTSWEEYRRKDTEVQRDFLKKIIDCGWETYTEYKFIGVLEGEAIDKIIERKQTLIKYLEVMIDNEKIDPQIYDSTETYDADYIIPSSENDKKSLLMELLKDNSMGNMAILARGENSSVGSNNYEDKKQKIIERVNDSRFVPIATVNMFLGAYCKNGYDTDIWYPCHRKEYLSAMISSIKKYLGEEEKGEKENCE